MRLLTLEPLPPGHACSLAHWQYRHFEPQPAPHTHDFHELFWVEEGHGLEFTGGLARPLTPGLVVLVRAEDAHGFCAASEGGLVHFRNFAFPSSLWFSIRERHPSPQPRWFDLPSPLERAWTLAPEELSHLRQSAHFLSQSPLDLLAAETFLLGVFHLLRLAEARRARSTLPPRLAAALERIRDPRHFIGGTLELARLAEYTPEHLARVIRRHLGITPTDVVNRARLEHAARQLCTTGRPIVDIAADCGLHNLGHFYDVFRTHFGTSPEKYRRHAFLPPLPARIETPP